MSVSCHMKLKIVQASSKTEKIKDLNDKYNFKNNFSSTLQDKKITDNNAEYTTQLSNAAPPARL